MNTKNIDILLDCIVDVTMSFLKNHIKIKVNNTSICETNIENKYSALVSFKANIRLNAKKTFFCLIAVGKELLERIFQVMMPFNLSSEEKKEMIEVLPDELINTVAGLAMSSFPDKYNDLVMSEPLSLNEKISETFKTNNSSASKRIETDSGDIICTITQMD